MGTAPDIKSADAPTRAMLEALLSARQLRAAYQPIVSCETGEIAGFESLARPMPETGFANPGVLFGVAEREALTWDVEALARAVAFEGVARFPAGVLLFVNSSPEVFCDARFVDRVTELVREVRGLTPSRVVLEITERGGEDDVARIAQQVARLKGAGFQIAVDDVGAGTSGLNRIMMLRPHWLKLDRELVSGIDENRYKLNLIRFLVHFARLSGVHVIAEGVERDEELRTLIGLGVRYVQGFVIGRPGAVCASISPEVGVKLRNAWSAAEASRLGDPRRTQLGQLAERAEAVPASTLIRELALRVLRLPGLSGIAVQDGARLVGWVTREALLNAARRTDSKLPVGFICSSDLGSLPPSATVTEALEMVAQREDATIGDPVLVAENDRIVGVVTLKRLLAATVGERGGAGLSGGAAGGGAETLAAQAGLPGKVLAEKHVRALIRQRAAGLDAALIDVRGFGDYNAFCGYDAGDRLIADLAELLRERCGPRASSPGWYVAHTGDDRFLVIGPHEELDAELTALTDVFEARVPATPAFLGPIGTAPSATDPQTLGALGLRIIHLPGVFARIGSPRQLAEMERAARAALRESERATGATGGARSVRISDTQLKQAG
jgi:EAL domain-containing protein (putative c-di-GMP-specific phosphodiesterase class I)/GGDEF domain-containing protein